MRALTAALVVASAAPVTLATCQDPPCHQAAEPATSTLGRLRERALAAEGVRVVCMPSDVVHDTLAPDAVRDFASTGPFPLSCVARGYRRNGALWERSEPVWVEAGQEVGDLVWRGRDAGLGIEFSPNRMPGARPGVLVTNVTGGAPADGVLEAGDRILAVDGHETIDAGRWEFIDLGTGPSGTVAVIDVEGMDGGRRVVEIVRAPIRVTMRALSAAFVVASAAPIALATCQGRPCQGPEPLAGIGEERVYCLPSDRDHDELWLGERGASSRRPVLADCVARGYRRHGRLWERSEPVWVEAGHEVEGLRYHDRDGGVGVQFADEREPGERPGARVEWIVPGSPADGVLEVGDRIVALDGVEMFDAGRWEFRDHSTGPIGSVVRVEVEGPSGHRTVELVRAAIE